MFFKYGIGYHLPHDITLTITKLKSSENKRPWKIQGLYTCYGF